MQSSTYDGVDLPDDYFDYDEFIREEFGGENSGQLFWNAVVLVGRCRDHSGSVPAFEPGFLLISPSSDEKLKKWAWPIPEWFPPPPIP